ncbi:macrophage migration inhibitory factor homolog [Momordica charantia]|uniref:Macrophage migration inhibitory factor homolog n=1 Tax=Momordica charantia TaxID=3673 RepID=A0A6J1CS88_MOMCH|nr:macrophage migration inhibitory factor homolog [Momordica charantia]
MPCLNISTNVNLDAVDISSLHSDATAAVAALLRRPEAHVMVVLKGSVSITFGGSADPAAHAELMSVGGFSPDVNQRLSAAIAAILEAKLSVPKHRFILKFYDVKGSDCGWNGSTC